ncbi:styrene monooxygenase/indole monooxygenase family protein [Marinactinospora thermotolerans]|uniref:2-polyprenyl-6-methoxyphenol hydroxylase n=1 Tax=Marinactinospora thermotolerans DSM 45154 TaxID=1122192 RepID=A0A1T4LDP2_9ACTN|nr:styrene monooxygenase/indole monooxygenase family protein [Marinactinospora thermotolerans]SJZ52688.1 2-polyprenyl-6-methoxyphenol hydroxylase [Marinactinospora thermotolerans DSM 45154]
MRRILIVGAGQSGLQLALGLLEDGYDVTVVSARTSEEIRAGRVTSTQCLFATALGLERALGLDLWADEAPRIEGVGVSLTGAGGERTADWLGRLHGDAQSVDQRVKMAEWLEEFEERGGRVVIHGVTVSDLEGFARMYDLVVVAAGRGEIAQVFDPDPARVAHPGPSRSLALAYVHGAGPRPGRPETTALHCAIAPGVGEFFVVPSYTLSGPCDILFLAGVPGGPLDVFEGVGDPDEHLEHTRELIERFFPWEGERFQDAEPTDARGVLSGAHTPIARRPVGRIGGTLVFGMADVVVANAPITSQGANSAARCAEIYRRAIVAHGDRPFDEAFMNATFAEYRAHVRHVTAWTEAMLRPTPRILGLLQAAGTRQDIADRYANAFDDPADLETWFLDSAAAPAALAGAVAG